MLLTLPQCVFCCGLEPCRPKAHLIKPPRFVNRILLVEWMPLQSMYAQGGGRKLGFSHRLELSLANLAINSVVICLKVKAQRLPTQFGS